MTKHNLRTVPATLVPVKDKPAEAEKIPRMMAKCTECGHEQFVEVDMVLPDIMLTDDETAPFMSTHFECEKCKHPMHITITTELFD